MKHKNSSLYKWRKQSGKHLSKQLGVSRLKGMRASMPGLGLQNQHFANTLLHCCSGAFTIIYQGVVRTHVFAEIKRLVESSALDSRAIKWQSKLKVGKIPVTQSEE